MSTLRVVIADDHYLVREGVRRALASSGAIEVVAAVGSADELELVVDREVPDAVVTDIRMPPGNTTDGIDATHRIRERHPGVGVVVLSQYNDATYAMELLRDGVAGLAYLLKERIGDPAALVGAVEAVAAGGSRIDPDVVAALVRGAPDDSSPLGTLTDREREVLAQMAEGRTNAGIAEQLHLSESSIEKYASSLFAKLELNDEPFVHRRVAAVLAYLHGQGMARPLDDDHA
ncbi:response regulator transcription factor [Agromyces sp. M3QZ16-3]|uniref:response regulator transcription factor n=1 Tax=Agromyces sp. M3QZ16-3 TaxID=3447585 RepID=UPI003F68F2F8